MEVKECNFSSAAERAAAYVASKMPYYKQPSLAYIEPFRMFGPIYYIGDKQVCVHLFDTGEGLILLDAGFPHTMHIITENIYHLGFDPHDIKWVILTHAHYDHIGVAMEYKHLYGCRIALSKVDTQLIREKPGYVTNPTGPVAIMTHYPEIDHEIEDGEHIRLGCIDMECKLIPGHTPGAMAFFCDVTEDGKTYYRAGEFGGAGQGSVTRFALEKNGLPYSLQDDMLASLEKMKAEHVDIMLGNHPYNNGTFEIREKQLAGDEKAFVDPTRWPEFLEKTEEAFRKLFAREWADEVRPDKR